MQRWRSGAAGLGLVLLAGCGGSGGNEIDAPAASSAASSEAVSASPPASASPAPAPAPSTSAPSSPGPTPAAEGPADAFGNLRDLPDAVAAVAEAGVQVPGTPVAAASWDDVNGQNLAVLSTVVEEGDEDTTTRLFATHDVFAGGVPRRLRDVNDGVEACPLDTSASFVTGDLAQAEASSTFENPRSDDPALAAQVRGPLEVTDVDGDQVGELTFAYSLGCRGDISPLTFKLLVLEDGARYILRGETWGAAEFVQQYGPLEGPQPEPLEADWPAALWQHATERYELYALY